MCAGFLRVSESKNMLDGTAVHPESYDAAKALLEKCGFDIKSSKTSDLQPLMEKAKAYRFFQAVRELEIGQPTLIDIINELMKRAATRATSCRRRFCAPTLSVWRI